MIGYSQSYGKAKQGCAPLRHSNLIFKVRVNKCTALALSKWFP